MKIHPFFRRLTAVLCLLLFSLPASAVEQGYTVFYGDRAQKKIAITVDDCYSALHVKEILDLCEAYDVPVTFFVIGSALKLTDRALWRRALALDCEIGNHTWSHARLYNLTNEEIQRQLTRTQEKVNAVLAFPYPMQVMRPPFGRLSKNAHHKSDIWVVNAIEEAGYLHAVRWDVDQTDPEKAVKDVQNGSILLYHTNARDVRCLKQLIPAVKEMGYTCVTVSELLGLPKPVYQAPGEM